MLKVNGVVPTPRAGETIAVPAVGVPEHATGIVPMAKYPENDPAGVLNEEVGGGPVTLVEVNTAPHADPLYNCAPKAAFPAPPEISDAL